MELAYKAHAEGYIEIGLLTLLMGFRYQTPAVTLLCLILELLVVCKSKHRQISIVCGAMLMLGGCYRPGAMFAVYYILKVCFPSNNFFEVAQFSIILCSGLFYASPYLIINYLLKCLVIQLLIIFSLLLWGRFTQYIYEIILSFNLLGALYSLYLGLHFELINSPNLLNVVGYGVFGLALTVAVTVVVKYAKIPNIYVRKVFHVPPLILFPLFESKFPDVFLIAVVGVLYTFIVLELLRYYTSKRQKGQKGPFFDQFNSAWEYMRSFIDKRDRYLWVTHLSLLTGMSVSFFIASQRLIRSSSVILPIGDAFAAIVGTKYGRIKIRGKSLEGTLAFILSTLLTFLIYSAIIGEFPSYGKLLTSIAITSIVELLSHQIDNLLLPLFFLYLYLYL